MRMYTICEPTMEVLCNDKFSIKDYKIHSKLYIYIYIYIYIYCSKLLLKTFYGLGISYPDATRTLSNYSSFSHNILPTHVSYLFSLYIYIYHRFIYIYIYIYIYDAKMA